MKLTPFIKELTEARMFFTPKDVKNMSVTEIGEVVYLIFMVLEILRWSKYNEAASYAGRTKDRSPYDKMYYAGTDLGNLLALITNQNMFADTIKTDAGVNLPVFQVNRYLGAVSSNSKSSGSDDQSFFWRLEDFLKLYSNSNFRYLRRNVGDWTNLDASDKRRVEQTLRREFDKRASNCDIYLWFKQNFKLKEGVEEHIVEAEQPFQGTPVWTKLSEADKHRLGNRLIELVQLAYAKAPKGSFVNTQADVLASNWLVTDLTGDGIPDAVIFYRVARADEAWSGNKIQGIGHNGQKKSKVSVLAHLEQLLKQPGWWMEGGVELRSTLLNHNIKYIKDENFLQELFPDSEFTMISPGTYIRTLDVGTTTPESVFGNPELRRHLEELYTKF